MWGLASIFRLTKSLFTEVIQKVDFFCTYSSVWIFYQLLCKPFERKGKEILENRKQTGL
jgi:hypothetical protein